MADESDHDPRVEFMWQWTEKLLKVDREEWQQMMDIEEHQKTLTDFLDSIPEWPGQMLFISHDNSGTLRPVISLPSELKVGRDAQGNVLKKICFVKNWEQIGLDKKLEEEDKLKMFGDISVLDVGPQPMEQLEVLTKHVFLPLLANIYECNTWTFQSKEDVLQHFLNLNVSISQVRGLLSDQLLLPMPYGIERIDKIVQNPYSGDTEADKELQMSIEGTVDKWAALINEVIQQESSIVLKKNPNATPDYEIEFWKDKRKLLESLQSRLLDKQVLKLSKYLEHIQSSYMGVLKTLIQNVSKAVIEAHDVLGYLRLVQNQLDRIHSAVHFQELERLLAPLMHCVSSFWANCTYFQRNSRIMTLLMEIVNMLLTMAHNYLDPTSLFVNITTKSLKKVKTAIKILEKFRLVFEYSQVKLASHFNCKNLDRGEVPILWNFPTQLIFKKFNAFLRRVKLVKNFLEASQVCYNLEHVAIGGPMGQTLTKQVAAIHKEFTGCVQAFKSISYDMLDPHNEQFIVDCAKFKSQLCDMDKRLAAILSMAFNDCGDLDQIAKYQLLAKLVLCDQKLAQKLFPECARIYEIAESEVNVCEKLVETHQKFYKETGHIMVEDFLPPTASVLTSIDRLRQRILKIPYKKNTSGYKVAARIKRLLMKLNHLDKTTFDAWEEKFVTHRKVLKQNLICVNPETSELCVNLSESILNVLQELRYLNLMGRRISADAKQLNARSDDIRDFYFNLQIAVDGYNNLKKNCRPEELKLLYTQIKLIDDMICDCTTNISWDSPEALEHICTLRNNVQHVEVLTAKTKVNINRIRELADSWNERALYLRKGNVMKPGLLKLSDRENRCNQRYEDIAEVGYTIHDLVYQNYKLYLNVEDSVIEEEEESPTQPDNVTKTVVKIGDISATGMTPEPSRTSDTKANTSKENEEQAFDCFAGPDSFSNTDVKDDSEYMGSDSVSRESSSLLLPSSPPRPLKTEAILADLVARDASLVPKWLNYLDFVDSIVFEGLLNSVGCSLLYIIDEMFHSDSTHTEPLFRVSLTLNDTEILFTPSLLSNMENGQSLCSLVRSIVEDILNMSEKIPRLSKRVENSYKDDIQSSCKIVQDLVEVIMKSVKQVTFKVLEYTFSQFDEYSYLWRDNEAEILTQFLTYGRALTPEERSYLGREGEEGVPVLRKMAPSNDAYKQRIDHFENLYKKFSLIDETKVFENWLLLDLKDFKKELLLRIQKWAMLFKNHLKDYVTLNLVELRDFIALASAALAPDSPLGSKDYEGLVDIVSYLKRVKERTSATDNMFRPLAAIVQLLKAYDVNFSEDVYLMLHSLPMRWSDMKEQANAAEKAAKAFITAEAARLRKRILLFNARQRNYVDSFKDKCFFQWGCVDPYREIDQAVYDMDMMDGEREVYLEQAALFEVTKPESNILVDVEHELEMAKQIWDYIHLIQSWMTEWKDTPWKKIDSNALLTQLNKFGEDLQDKLHPDIHGWSVFQSLRDDIRNMIFSLTAVTILQSPSIRTRHWDELMQMTGVKFNINIDESTKLRDLLELQLYEYEDAVNTLVEKSNKEQEIEIALEKIKQTWSPLKFEFERDAKTDTPLMRNANAVLKMQEDTQSQLETLVSAQFVDFFLQDLHDWETKLSEVRNLITLWRQAEDYWHNLINKSKLPEEMRSKLQQDMSEKVSLCEETYHDFKTLANDLAKDPNVLRATQKQGLTDIVLTHIINNLISCDTALSSTSTSQLTHTQRNTRT